MKRSPWLFIGCVLGEMVKARFTAVAEYATVRAILQLAMSSPGSIMPMILASTRVGRVGMHLLCVVQDHRWSWHIAGIRREFQA